MQKGKVGAQLARSLGGKADRGYFTGHAWEKDTLLRTQRGGQPFQNARESPGFLQNASMLMFLNGNSEKEK